MADKLKSWKKEALRRLEDVCCPNGRVPREVAVAFITKSAWWESHPAGPVRAPRHAERITGGESSWAVEFGANSFLISQAASGCCKTIRAWLSRQAGPISAQSWATLQDDLAVIIRSSVSNYRGDKYASYGEDSSDKLLFGAQAISIADFVRVLGDYLKMPEMYTFQSTRKRKATPVTPNGKGNDNTNLVVCPRCKTRVNAQKLQKHLQERCPKRHDNLKRDDIKR